MRLTTSRDGGEGYGECCRRRQRAADASSHGLCGVEDRVARIMVRAICSMATGKRTTLTTQVRAS